MSPAAGPAAGGSSRRCVLGAAGLGGSLLVLSGLGGCGLRLEHAAAPRAPARVPVPDEAGLLRTLSAVALLASLAGRVRPATPLSTRLATQHQEQVAVVRDRLRTAGVPDAVTRAASASPGAPSTDPVPPSTPPTTPTTSTTSTPAPATPPPATAAALGTAEATAVVSELLAVLPHLGPASRPLVGSVASCAAAAAAELGHPVTWPAATPLPGAAAAQLLDASRATAYGLEVAAARLDGVERAAVLTTLTAVRRRVVSLQAAAGAAARPQPLGYPLPFRVTGAAAVRRLVTHVLAGLVADGLGPLTSGALASGSTAVTTVVRLQAEAVGLGRRWGVTPTPFPGMTLP